MATQYSGRNSYRIVIRLIQLTSKALCNKHGAFFIGLQHLEFTEKKKYFIESAIYLLRFIEVSNNQEKVRSLRQKLIFYITWKCC